MKFQNSRQKRHYRVRKTVAGTAERPRLSVYRSNKHVFAQLIDDVKGVTLASASSANIKKVKGSKSVLAQEVGKEIASSAIKAKIEQIVFDRGGYRYHGRVKAVADGAREAGLKF